MSSHIETILEGKGIEAALTFTIGYITGAHHGQTRKWSDLPYVTHPINATALLTEYSNDPYLQMAMLLHDVLEDTSISEADMREIFGDHVTDIVVWLSHTTTLDDGNRATRMQTECLRLSNAPWAVKLLKMCDLLDNAPSIFEHGKGFDYTYAEEMMDLLTVFTNVNDELHSRCEKVVIDFYKRKNNDSK